MPIQAHDAALFRRAAFKQRLRHRDDAIVQPPEDLRVRTAKLAQHLPRVLAQTRGGCVVGARPDDWAMWLKAVQATGVRAHTGLKYESSAMAYQAAIEGHGVAIAQKVLVEDDLQSGRLCQPFALELDLQGFTYYFVFPIGREKRKELDIFRQWLKSQ
ncbi:MAG TPA: LysR substrate-binding domain-containing protein [Azospirillum sp.]|nr:LysR substrate-binding domain-containing protein [Azospirillum sp.]